MLRRMLIAATALAIGCPSHAPTVPVPTPIDDDAPVRIRIARLEAKRADGVKDLVELATTGSPLERELALRGLGRIGSPDAITALQHALRSDDPATASNACVALGVAASLDDTAPLEGVLATLHMQRWTREQMLLTIEAVGRAGGTVDQAALVGFVHAHADTQFPRTTVGLALGRMGRRKIALVPEARAWLVTTTADAEWFPRYAATYALSREHEPPLDEAVNAALAKRVTDDDPQIRATAIAGLARRKTVAAARKEIEDSLRDRDWRVAVEAVRALAGEQGDDAGRAAVLKSLGAQMTALENGDAPAAHVVIEALQLLGKHDQHAPEIAARAQKLTDPLTRAWIINAAGTDDASLPDHLRLPLLATQRASGARASGARASGARASGARAMVRVLLEHKDMRVRAAALPLLAKMWKDGDASDHRATITTFVAALASPDPILAGSAVDAVDALYDAIGTGDHGAIDDQIVARAAREKDVELGASLFELIGKRVIANGASACRTGYDGPPVRAKAATACLKALGETPPAATRGDVAPPPVDVAAVIGKSVRWNIRTTRGVIQIELLPDVAPWNVATIVALTKRGFYDGLEFHRVVGNFVVQGGDPTMSGWGGPGFTTPAEPGPEHFEAGAVGIADAGRDSGGSQFFVMHSRAPHLDARYTIVGVVTNGQNYADGLLIGDKIEKATVWVEDRRR